MIQINSFTIYCPNKHIVLRLLTYVLGKHRPLQTFLQIHWDVEHVEDPLHQLPGGAGVRDVHRHLQLEQQLLVGACRVRELERLRYVLANFCGHCLSQIHNNRRRVDSNGATVNVTDVSVTVTSI